MYTHTHADAQLRTGPNYRYNKTDIQGERTRFCLSTGPWTKHSQVWIQFTGRSCTRVTSNTTKVQGAALIEDGVVCQRFKKVPQFFYCSLISFHVAGYMQHTASALTLKYGHTILHVYTSILQVLKRSQDLTVKSKTMHASFPTLFHTSHPAYLIRKSEDITKLG